MWTLLALLFTAAWVYAVYLTYTKGRKYINDIINKLKRKDNGK